MSSTPRSTRILLSVYLAVVASASSLCGQTRCPVLLKSPLVSQQLVTLAAGVDRTHLRRGQPLLVTLTLTAGPRGVFLPDDFRDFLQSCERGFAASLLTPRGTAADSRIQGCVASIGYSPDDTAQDQLKHYVRLQPAETRTWQTTLPTSQVRPGTVCLHAEYISSGYMLNEVARLPAVGGTMASGYILAQPIRIRISKQPGSHPH